MARSVFRSPWVRAGWQRAEAEGERSRLQARAITSAMIAVLVLGGVVLRVHGFGAPAHPTFDEELFTRNAHNYLVGAPDLNDHPPLGKLVIAVGLLLFDYDSVGWRFTSVCFGVQTIAIAFLLARELFEDSRSGWFAAALLASDGFFVAHSRAGLLDGTLTCLVLWSVLLAVTARGAIGVLASAVMVGLAMSVKWSGAFAVFPAAAAVLLLGRTRKRNVAWFVVVPIVHVAIWMLGLWMTGQSNDPVSLWKVMTGLFRHHLEMGRGTNPLASSWYTWLAIYHPIVVKLSVHGVTSRYASEGGNPLPWFGGVALAIGMPLLALLSTFWSKARSLLDRVAPRARSAMLISALGWFALLSPWMVARGKYTFMYHYLPSHGFALIALGGFLATLERRLPRVTLAFTAATLCVAAYLAPVWGEWSLSEGAAARRLVLPTWKP